MCASLSHVLCVRECGTRRPRAPGFVPYTRKPSQVQVPLRDLRRAARAAAVAESPGPSLGDKVLGPGIFPLALLFCLPPYHWPHPVLCFVPVWHHAEGGRAISSHGGGQC